MLLVEVKQVMETPSQRKEKAAPTKVDSLDNPQMALEMAGAGAGLVLILELLLPGEVEHRALLC
jgi:hypothetical protein